LGVNKRKERILLPGEIPNPMEDIHGCKFNSRCPIAKEICSFESPELKEMGKDHFVACHFAEKMEI